MFNKKKILSLTLAATLLLTMAGGCSKPAATGDAAPKEETKTEANAETPKTEDKKEETAPGTEATGDKMKISWIGWTTPTDQDGEIVKMLEDKFNVDFDMRERGDDAAFDVKLASGEVPDVFSTAAKKYTKFIEDEIICEIPQADIEANAPNLYAMYKAESAKYLDYPVVDGKNYGLIVPNPESGDVRPLIVWRGDWLEKVGITKVPDTLAEMETAMYKFRNEDPDGNGQADTYGLSSTMMDAVYGAYGFLPNNWTRVDGKLVYGAVQPEMKSALEVLSKWYKDQVIEPEYGSPTAENRGGEWSVSTIFVNGLIGATTFPEYLYWKPAKQAGEREGSNIVEMKKINPAAVEKLVYGRPPEGPNGKRGLNLRSGLQGAFITFGNQLKDDTDKKKKILEIFDYCSGTLDGYMLSRYGVEGKHYEMKDGYPIALGSYSDWNEIVKIGAGATFNNAIWMPSIIEKVNAEYKWGTTVPGLKEDGILNEIYIPLPSQAKLGTELDKIKGEAYTEIITGVKPIEYFDEFVKTWRDAGGATLEEEAAKR